MIGRMLGQELEKDAGHWNSSLFLWIPDGEMEPRVVLHHPSVDRMATRMPIPVACSKQETQRFNHCTGKFTHQHSSEYEWMGIREKLGDDNDHRVDMPSAEAGQ